MNTATLEVAVTGATGAGKSSFINAVRELGEDDEGAAPTGETETTAQPTRYTHPRYPHVAFWDLPGIGGQVCPADDYTKKMSFDQYDFFIIIGSKRFTEYDTLLVKDIQNRGKKFFFVRSQVDTDIRAAERRTSFNRQQTLDTIRQDCVRNLQSETLPDPQVFLISSHQLDEFDFDQLIDALQEDLSEQKVSAPGRSPRVCALL
ncbi:interferon-gamma-inducible GTPase 10 [Amia ocellicauda]|uniref:interferon-gamma-inducible GTPase 10 n=1 Tax=Amia ocellicauda TaxID=2972642 RepID=UPI0034639010